MNPWNQFATALAADLRIKVAPCSVETPEAERVDIVVYRQDDLYSLAESLTAKASGLGVIVANTGGKNPDPAAKKLLMGGNFSISVWASRIHSGELKADDLCWLLGDAAHGFVLAAGPNDLTRRLEIEDVAIVPDNRFLVWEAKGRVKRLQRPESAPLSWDTESDLWNS